MFAENVKYQFLNAARTPGIRAIWIGQDKLICELLQQRGFEAHPHRSLKGVFYSLRAGYTFIGAFLQPKHWRFTGRSKIIQLWHGKSLKKTGYEGNYGFKRFTGSWYKRFLASSIFDLPYRFIAMSNYLANYIVSDFHMPPERIMVTGLPKHDVFFRSIEGAEIDIDTELQQAMEKARAKNPRRLILYGPTFRPDGSDPLQKTDFGKLDSLLAALNDQMIVTLHPKFSTKDWRKQDLQHITFSQCDHDAYPLFPLFDLIITDYSSLGLEFLMMGKPAIHFVYDLEEFRKGMGIYEDLWDIMPGPKVYSFDELLKALEEDLDVYTERRATAQKKLYEFFDGKAAERITNIILEK